LQFIIINLFLLAVRVS